MRLNHLFAEIGGRHTEQLRFGFCGLAAGLAVEVTAERRVFQSSNRIGPLLRQPLAQGVGNFILGRPRNYVSGRALNHGDLGPFLRHRGDNGHGSCATAYDDHLFTVVIEVFWPKLRM